MTRRSNECATELLETDKESLRGRRVRVSCDGCGDGGWRMEDGGRSFRNLERYNRTRTMVVVRIVNVLLLESGEAPTEK
jgi:hypothetical protein